MTTGDSPQWLLLGRYRVLGELGRGAMGIVYKVHDERLDRVIALKTIRKDRVLAEGESEQDVLDRFRREAQSAGKLSHPGIVTIYDISEEGNDLYLAMEFVDGDPLGQRMRATPRMPIAEAARIVTGICDALAYAHAHGVVHRDVKPDNVMCCPNGTMKLTDFGIARVVSGPATHVGRPMGTPRYMAPEQWRGDAVDGRADVYAVGIILYELLTGRPTFVTHTPSELRDRVLHEEPALPSLVNRALPVAVNSIVRRAIAREPGDRYATADELARALAPFVTGEVVAEPEPDLATAVTAVRASPVESTVAASKPAGMTPGGGTGRMIALVVGALGVIAGMWWMMQPRRSLPMPPKATVATAAPVVAAAVAETPPPVEPTASVAATITAAEPTPEPAAAYRDASVTLVDPAQTEEAKLAVVAMLAGDSQDAATDLLVESTRNASVLVSMAAVKALAGRSCARVTEPLTALLTDGEWQRRAWAAKILGTDGCTGARDAIAARRGEETDPRVTKLMDDAIEMLDEKEKAR